MSDNTLLYYLENEILPIYDTYDRGHNRDHIEDVVKNSLELSQALDQSVDVDMVLTAAYFHDLGMPQGRDTHHLSSAQMLREDEFIRDYFSDEQIHIIAEAIEDHRASSKIEPRSIYGQILSSADRIIHIDTIIKRTYYYGLKYYEGISFDEQLERIYQHILVKYGEGGYLKVPILTKANEESLNALRILISDKEKFLVYCSQNLL